MPDRTQHPLSGHQRHGLNNINDGFSDTLDDLTKGLADVLGDLGQGLIEFLNRLTADKEHQPNSVEKKDAYAKLKSWERLAADDEKSQVLGKAAEFIKGQFEPSEKEAAHGKQEKFQQAELVRDRFIAVPHKITSLPGYELLLAQQRQALEQEQERAHPSQGMVSATRLEAADARQAMDEQQHRHEVRQDLQDPAMPDARRDDFDLYLQAARQLNAKALQQGQKIEGEIVAIAKVDDKNYYVLEEEIAQFAVPAGHKQEYEIGDQISAIRKKESFEIEDAYGYGR